MADRSSGLEVGGSRMVQSMAAVMLAAGVGVAAVAYEDNGES
jgi:hypothetical protein